MGFYESSGSDNYWTRITAGLIVHVQSQFRSHRQLCSQSNTVSWCWYLVCCSSRSCLSPSSSLSSESSSCSIISTDSSVIIRAASTPLGPGSGSTGLRRTSAGAMSDVPTSITHCSSSAMPQCLTNAQINSQFFRHTLLHHLNVSINDDKVSSANTIPILGKCSNNENRLSSNFIQGKPC